MQADSGRFESQQLPMAESGHLQAGQFTALVSNPTDNTVTTAYILRLHPRPEARSLGEARGLVVNDYQQYLEDQWVRELRKQYPVTINEAVVAGLPK